jgi:hypothetical protein
LPADREGEKRRFLKKGDENMVLKLWGKSFKIEGTGRRKRP